ncbi:MAG: LytR C-terminal domain-containing protein [Bacteroidota bacterium]
MENFKTKKKKSSGPTSLKSSTVNFLLNISIFLLTVVIIYMGYSIYMKLSHHTNDAGALNANQAASDMIQVEVLNGCGIGGIGDKFTDFLRANNFDVVKTGNYISSDLDESMVICRTDNMANAYKVAKALGIKNENVIQQLNKDYFLDVSIVVGRDYFNLAPYK